MNEGDVPSRGVAPADAAPHVPWPTWRKVLAYVLLAALSLASIWIVDLKVHRPAQMPLSHPGKSSLSVPSTP